MHPHHTTPPWSPEERRRTLRSSLKAVLQSTADRPAVFLTCRVLTVLAAVVFLLVDDLGYNSFFHNPDHKTPSVNALARDEGVILEGTCTFQLHRWEPVHRLVPHVIPNHFYSTVRCRKTLSHLSAFTVCSVDGVAY